MPSLFSKIVAGEIPCHRVAEDENYLAFLDIFPLKRGHTLVIPKKEVDYIFDLDNDTYTGLMSFAARVAKAIGQTIDCKRVGVSVIGLEVPHAHVHLIPIQGVHDMNFANAKLKFSKEEFEQIAASISAAFQ